MGPWIVTLYLSLIILSHAEEQILITPGEAPLDPAEITEPEAPLSPQEDQVLAQESLVASKCQDWTCQVDAALADPKNNPVCGGIENQTIRKKSFVDAGLVFVRPFVILSDSTLGTPACRYYLLKVAERQAAARLKELEDAPDPIRETFEIASHAASLEGTCYQNELVSDTAQRSYFAEIIEKSAKNSDLIYSTHLYDGCSILGGKKIKLEGRRTASCVFQNIVLDTTCLNQDAPTLKKLGASIKNVRPSASTCLQSINSDLSLELEGHFKNSAPVTQICCGSSCAQSVFTSPQTKLGLEIDASPSHAGTNGTIRIATSTLTRNSASLTSTLFRAFLDRSGQPRSWDYPYYDKWKRTPHFITTGTQSCPLRNSTKSYARALWRYDCVTYNGVTAFDGSSPNKKKCLAVEYPGSGGNPGKVEAFQTSTEFENKYGLINVGSMGSKFCVASSGCNNQEIVSFPLEPYQVDPIYSCEAACFQKSSSTIDATIAQQGCGHVTQFTHSSRFQPEANGTSLYGRRIRCGSTVDEFTSGYDAYPGEINLSQ